MKRPRLITRRRAKWAGLTLFFTIALTIGLTLFYMPLYQQINRTTGRLTSFRLQHGSAHFIAMTVNAGGSGNNGTHRTWLLQWYSKFDKVTGSKPIRWWPSVERASIPGTTVIIIPLWVPLLMTALPTGFLFYKGRKPKPGCCTKCRYNLAGLKDNRCPECGTTITP